MDSCFVLTVLTISGDMLTFAKLKERDTLPMKGVKQRPPFLLRMVARRISHSLRSGDMVTRSLPEDEEKQHVARLDGYEFTVLLSVLKDHEDALIVANRTRGELSMHM